MKIIVFDTDNDFELYALKPDYGIYKSEISGMYYYDADFTDQYQKDLEDGVCYCIDCPESKVRKRKCVSKGAISKDVENILDCLFSEIKDNYPKAEIINYKRNTENIL